MNTNQHKIALNGVLVISIYFLFMSAACQKSNLSMDLEATDPNEPIINFVDTVLENNTTYLIENSSILDIHTGHIQKSQQILVEDGIITAIGESIPISDSVKVFDIDHRYVLPGLMNMHTHTAEPNDFFLNLANGVTTVRHLWGNVTLLELRDYFRTHPYLGPDLYVASAGFEEPPSYWPGANLIEDYSKLEHQVKSQAEQGFDYIKVYENLSSTAYFALKEAADKAEIPLVGHLPYSANLEAVLTTNFQKSIEHIDCYLEYLAKEGTNINHPKTYQIDPKKLQKIIELTAQSEVWNCPTMTITTRTANQKTQLAANPHLKYVSPKMKAWFTSQAAGLNHWNATDYMRHKNQLVKALYHSGAKIMLGVDTGLRYLLPGFTVHEELENLVEAGIPELGALQMATINAAQFLGQEELLGSVEVSKRADLLILDKNPLENIQHTNNIFAVARGRYWLSKIYLQKQLEIIAEEY